MTNAASRASKRRSAAARPAGALRLRVQDLMTKHVYTLHPNDDLHALQDLMDEEHIRHVPVVAEDQRLVGLVSHRDLLRGALVGAADLPLSMMNDLLRRTQVSDIMVQEVETVEPTDDLRNAAQVMLENKYGCLPVVEGDRLVGILTEADFVRYLAERG